MMVIDNKLLELWNKTLAILRDEIAGISFDTWIKIIEPISLNGNVVTLSVPSEFNKGILDTRYAPRIKKIIESISGKEYVVNFIVIYPENISPKNTEKRDNSKDNCVDEAVPPLLNQKYGFENFIIGECNHFAYTLALEVAKYPSKKYNPIFIFGGVGVGKTHLLKSINNFVLVDSPLLNILYITTEKFTNGLINAIRNDKDMQFRKSFENTDILIIDNLQCMCGKERTTEELYNIINSLLEANKQIIIASTKPPEEISIFKERFTSIFELSAVAEIKNTDYETKLSILREKVKTENINMPNEVIELIADKTSSNIRELNSALNRIAAISSLTGKEINIDMAFDSLKYL